MHNIKNTNPEGFEYIKFVQEEFGLLDGYEQTKIINHTELSKYYPDNTYKWGDRKTTINGMPIAVYRDDDGNLQITTVDLTHCLIIGATGSGKTQLLMMQLEYIIRACERGKDKNIPSFCISDPKNELYKKFRHKLEKYFNVICMNFVDYEKSVHWNPLGKIYALHQKYLSIESTVEAIYDGGVYKSRFQNTIYETQKGLDAAISQAKNNVWAEMSVEIENIARKICPTLSTKEPVWEDGARDTFKAIIYGMLEDNIPEDRFNFNTIVEIFSSFGKDNDYDNNYFEGRDHETSNAYKYASRYVLLDARSTRDGYMSTLSGMLNIIRDPAVRTITSDNSFVFSDFDDGKKPSVIFLTYPDETKTYGGIISLFLSSLYTELIKMVRANGDRPRNSPFIFLLDEFGNLPQFPDFSTNISAARARNIWFWIVLQSYAQLNSVYGNDTAKIIKDNLNQKIFLGTNDRETAEEFSRECGKYTRISPSSVLSGNDKKIQYGIETVAVVTVSKLSQLSVGECVVKRMNAPVVISKFERHYLCPEFAFEDVEEQPVDNVERIKPYPKTQKDDLPDLAKKEYVKELEKQFIDIISGSKKVTIAEIQNKLNIPYSVAVELISCAQNRGWMGVQAVGTGYKVIQNGIARGLVYMSRNMCDTIIDEFEESQLRLLEYICCNYCVNLVDLQKAADKIEHSVSLTQLLRLFENFKLVSKVGECYIINISKETMDILKGMLPERKKRKHFYFDF